MTDLRPLDPATCARADLLDLGAGAGRRLRSEARQFASEHPLGIDRTPNKVARAQAAGLPVCCADFNELDPAAFPAVKVVVFDNVLEHLPSLAAVESAFGRACDLASHLVYLRHPSFEDEEYLAPMGLKQYWTDWPDAHTAKVRLHEFVAMAARRGVYDISVRPLVRAFDSDDPTILPAAASPNQRKRAEERGEYGVYEEARHGPKPFVEFDRPVYFAFDLFFFLHPDRPAIRYDAETDAARARPFTRWSRGDRRARWRPEGRFRVRRVRRTRRA